MKRLYLLMAMLAISMTALYAQSSLNIAQLFDGRYQNDPDAVETLITGSSLRPYNLSVYRSITITGDKSHAEVIEPLVRRDARKAVDREVINKAGRLYFGFYHMPPTSSGDERYILYLNRHPVGGNKIILLYLEGSASQQQVKRLLKK